jgi:hypothetical protein
MRRCWRCLRNDNRNERRGGEDHRRHFGHPWAVAPRGPGRLQGSALIIHAGDIGSPDVIQVLRNLAPVFAVRGNVDREAWARRLARTKVLEVDDSSPFRLAI